MDDQSGIIDTYIGSGASTLSLFRSPRTQAALLPRQCRSSSRFNGAKAVFDTTSASPRRRPFSLPTSISFSSRESKTSPNTSWIRGANIHLDSYRPCSGWRRHTLPLRRQGTAPSDASTRERIAYHGISGPESLVRPRIATLICVYGLVSNNSHVGCLDFASICRLRRKPGLGSGTKSASSGKIRRRT